MPPTDDTLMLGVDTGGTCTDAVLMRGEREVIASAKALTTRDDLAIGIGSAVRSVLAQAGVAPGRIGMAALSTTLATNALVEGQGGRAALVLIGFRPGDAARHGLGRALAGDPLLEIAGGHAHDGTEAAPLDLAALERRLAGLDGITAFAVAAQFAVRNPAHELAAAAAIRAATGRPVTLSHDLSARLGGPRRALTALLNARLAGLTHRLIGRAGAVLQALGVTAPLMVVRGDGALMSAATAEARPIETILSGPAASILGARWLTGARDALVSDIGGTTTDIALLRGGRPAIDPDGAQVGGWRTMVEAVAMRTTGLGGDSEVRLDDAAAGGIVLGPRRLVPVGLLAQEAPDIVHGALDRQLAAPVPGVHDASFVRAVAGAGAAAEGLGPREAAVLGRIGGTVQPLDRVLEARTEMQALDRLVARGLVQLSGPTPSDASHVLGDAALWDAGAADKALRLMARRRDSRGAILAADGAGLARRIVDALTRQTKLALLEAAFAEEAPGGFDLPPGDLARHELTARGLAGHRGLIALDAALNVPLIGLGASAGLYYPAVGRALRCETIVPDHAGVANAIGAVVGRVTLRRSGSVTAQGEGRYRAHLETGPEDFTDRAAALARLEAELRRAATDAAAAAGAVDIQVSVLRDLRQVQAEARAVFLEAVLTVEATGRPRIAG